MTAVDEATTPEQVAQKWEETAKSFRANGARLDREVDEARAQIRALQSGENNSSSVDDDIAELQREITRKEAVALDQYKKARDCDQFAGEERRKK